LREAILCTEFLCPFTTGFVFNSTVVRVSKSLDDALSGNLHYNSTGCFIEVLFTQLIGNIIFSVLTEPLLSQRPQGKVPFLRSGKCDAPHVE